MFQTGLLDQRVTSNLDNHLAPALYSSALEANTVLLRGAFDLSLMDKAFSSATFYMKISALLRPWTFSPLNDLL
jgi:hypothetical protein